jgi:hypothetical protein
MSLPAPKEPRHDGGRWETIRYALDSNARTLRLCLIRAVAIASPVAATVITMLLRHMLLGGAGIREHAGDVERGFVVQCLSLAGDLSAGPLTGAWLVSYDPEGNDDARPGRGHRVYRRRMDRAFPGGTREPAATPGRQAQPAAHRVHYPVHSGRPPGADPAARA